MSAVQTFQPNLPLSKVIKSKTNPREYRDEKAFEDLVASVRAQGVIVPILVRIIKGKMDTFELVYGEQRLDAAKKAGLETVPATIRELTDDQAMELQIMENLHRKDVHPMDEAQGFVRMLKVHRSDGMLHSVETIAASVGKPPSYVLQRMKLADLIEPVKKAFWKNQIYLGHALELARLQPKDQKPALEYASDGDVGGGDQPVTVDDLKRWIQSEFHLDLRKAAFNKKDPDLVPAAGSCLSCPKRSGFNKTLFPDITAGDTCTDPACFKSKQVAHLNIIKAKLQRDGKKVVEITDSYRKPEGHPDAITYRSFKEVKGKSCSYACTGLVVEGVEKGKTKDVCTNKECARHWGKEERQTAAPKDPVKAALNQLKLNIEDETSKRLVKEIWRQLPGKVSGEMTHADYVEALQGFNWMEREQIEESFKVNLDNRKKLSGMPSGQLVKMLKFGLICAWTEAEGEEYLERKAKELGIDVKAMEKGIRAKVTEELTPKEKGTCRICRCTHEKPCKLKIKGMKEAVKPCAWTDTTETLCDNPKCVKAAKKLAKKKAGK